MNVMELTGRERTHVKQFKTPRFAAHPEAGQAFLAMRELAARSGIDLRPISAFRDYRSQLRIWNLKYTGKRPLFDDRGVPIDIETLGEDKIIESILKWSALPGGSRHHWGTDIDLFDAAAVDSGYRVKLLPEETEPGGVFFKSRRWLDKHMGRFGFFRPYASFNGGIHPEPWHLSYRPVAKSALDALTLTILRNAVEDSDIKGKSLILKSLPDIYQTYVRNITH